MRQPTTPARRARTRVRAAVLATASLVSAALLIGAVAGPAQAHHGFDDYDTQRLYYLSGTVSQVQWGDPHSHFTLTLDDNLPTDTPERELPEQLRAPEDRGPIEVAPSYPGSHDELRVTIAPPTYTGMWGLDRPLADDERVEAVGYVGKSHEDEFRPVVFWYGDGQPVNQVLGNELPARPMPVPYADPGSSSTSSAPDTNPAVVWGTTGVVLLVALAGGIAYVRARTKRA